MKTTLVTLLASTLFVAAQAPPALPASRPPVSALATGQVVTPFPAVPPSPAAARPGPASLAPPSPGSIPMQTNAMQAISPRFGVGAAAGSMDDVATNQFNFPSIDINQFLTFYAELIGRTILRPATLPAPTITLKTQAPLTRKEALQAFDTLLAMNGITIIKIGDKFAKAVPAASAFQEAAPFSKMDPDALPETGQYDVHLVQLRYVKPSELKPVLDPFGKIPNGVLAIDSSGILVIRDYAENAKRMLEMIKQIDISIPAEFVSEVIPIKYALASEISSALNSLSGGGGGGTTVGRSSTGTTGARSTTTRPTTPGYPGSTMPGMSGMQGGMGMSTPFGSSTALGSTTPGTTTGGGSSFTDRLRSIMQKATTSGDLQILGTTKIIADERTNSLLIFATREDMKMIKDIIGKLDVVLAQVIIEAIIMEVSLGDQVDVGFSYRGQPHNIGDYFQGVGLIKNTQLLTPGDFSAGSTNGGGLSGLTYLARFGDDFTASMSAIAQDSRVNVLSRPRIQTSHAVPASIQIGTSRPIVTGSYSYYGGGPQSQYQYQNFGITLNVTPLINPDGLVVMDIEQQVQSINKEIQVDAYLRMPELTTRAANAKVAVRNKETILLGGFISTQVSNTKSGVPILKDIPLLGFLFTSTGKKNDRGELVILMRPTVLATPEIASQVATDMRARMPGIRSAEAQNQIDEDMLLQKEIRKEEASQQALEQSSVPKEEKRGFFNWFIPAAPPETKAPDAEEFRGGEKAIQLEPQSDLPKDEQGTEKVSPEAAPLVPPTSLVPDTSGEAAVQATAAEERRAKAEAELARKMTEAESKQQSRAVAEAARKAEEQRLAAEKAQAKAKAEQTQKRVNPEWESFNQITPVTLEQKKALESGAPPPP